MPEKCAGREVCSNVDKDVNIEDKDDDANQHKLTEMVKRVEET
jgi:hypothetical protein